MAVYYKWIKGCNAGASLTSGLWTYIKWGSGEVGSDVSNLPHILTYKGKDDTQTKENDLGYILTNKATGVSIDRSWSFNNEMKILNANPIKFASETGDNCGSIYGSGNNIILSPSKNFLIRDDENDNSTMISVNTSSSDSYRTTSSNNKRYKITLAADLKKYCVEILRDNTSARGVYIIDENEQSANDAGKFKAVFENMSINIPQGYLTVTNDIETEKGNIKAGGYVEASYFNARSDIRSKENIQLADYCALDIVKSLPVYNFNYTGQTERVTGILAQDLLKNQPQELNLVSNINATGVNGDFMSIKNDKLMFILLKAIQEQEAEIQLLKDKLDFLLKNS